MNQSELMRYSRHIMLPEIDIIGQEKLAESSIAIIGLGGLGSPSSIYLAASGIGVLNLFDDDFVELSNLQRQIIFDSSDIGERKNLAAKKKLLNLNENIVCNSFSERISEANIDDCLENSEYVIDCSDNFETRKIINEYCFRTKKDLISGACIGWKGQIFNFKFSSSESPCYECLFEGLDEEDLSCRESSIFSPLAGLIGTFLAIETIKNILKLNHSEENFLEINSLTNEIKKRKMVINSFCKICSNK